MFAAELPLLALPLANPTMIVARNISRQIAARAVLGKLCTRSDLTYRSAVPKSRHRSDSRRLLVSSGDRGLSSEKPRDSRPLEVLRAWISALWVSTY